MLQLRHEELLRQCYRLFCASDNLAQLRKLLHKFRTQFGAELDVNYCGPIHESNTLLNLAARCGSIRCAGEPRNAPALESVKRGSECSPHGQGGADSGARQVCKGARDCVRGGHRGA